MKIKNKLGIVQVSVATHFYAYLFMRLGILSAVNS